MIDQFDELIASKNFSWRLGDILPKVLVAGENAGVLTEEGAKLLDVTGQLKSGIPLCPPEGDAGTGMVATNRRASPPCDRTARRASCRCGFSTSGARFTSRRGSTPSLDRTCGATRARRSPSTRKAAPTARSSSRAGWSSSTRTAKTTAGEISTVASPVDTSTTPRRTITSPRRSTSRGRCSQSTSRRQRSRRGGCRARVNRGTRASGPSATTSTDRRCARSPSPAEAPPGASCASDDGGPEIGEGLGTRHRTALAAPRTLPSTSR